MPTFCIDCELSEDDSLVYLLALDVPWSMRT